MDSEIALLRHFTRTSDAEAFSRIVQRHAGLVYGACLRVLSDRDKAADATQETFLELLRNAEKITDSVPSWLHRVATRRAINMVHKDLSRRRREVKYAAERPLKTSRWEDISTCIDEGLDELDDEMREILIKHFFEGRTAVAIAADKEISQPTVSRRLEAGIAELRQKLKKRGIIVVAALGSLLARNAVEAAPATVLKELGKIALVGGQAAAASGVGTAATAAGAGAEAAASAAATAVKVKIITVVAAAVVGVGGVATYRHVTQEPERPAPQKRVEEPMVRPRRSQPRPSRNVRRQEPAEDVATARQPQIMGDMVVSGGQDEEVTDSTSAERPSSTAARDSDDSESIGRGAGFGMMGGFAGGRDEQEEPDRPQEPDPNHDVNQPPEPPFSIE